MAAKDSRPDTENKPADDPPPPYQVDSSTPYPQQPGYPVPPPVYQLQPGYQAQPGNQAPPGGQVYHGAPAGGFLVTTQPGPPFVVQGNVQASPPDYQGLAWFACLCCCWPVGILAILKSNEVRNSMARGDYNSARVASNSARTFSYLAIGLGVSFLVMYIIALIMVFIFLRVH
ncbi:proline-rich transmembrane protein 1-like isoform X2 [Stylophora pistillata]|uniref:proline-rich transmembrane protein 1-like isoform X2 n=1 Tax=Stylophora pistillata TaxID=50429 RepID=UPI000C03B2AB|nr:proline-rich transmembrane protein 1-like isoform X2 [Stylophora pistillata]